ncbi:MAG: SGNH/GDSL hydrolase family protein [bacterium]
MTDMKPVRYLALGDSYTIGEAVAASERFPAQLADRLRSEGMHDSASPQIIARTGWTTDELATAIAGAPPDSPFDLVTLLIGVNNQFRGQPLTEYREGFRDLLRTAMSFAGGQTERVIVISIPDWGVTPFAEGRDRRQISAEIDAFNEVAAEEAKHARVRFIDITPISRLAGDEPGLIADDGLHPSGEMYSRWVEALMPEVRAALSPG